MKQIGIVIPARYGSTRLPGKVLKPLRGKPMVQWVYEAAAEVVAKLPGRSWVAVATDHPLVAQTVQAFGGQVVMTSVDLKSGTDRVAAAAEQLPADIYVNLQADEPEITSEVLLSAIQDFEGKGWEMGTIATPLESLAAFRSPQVVKVLCDLQSQALYFSRQPLPWMDGSEAEQSECLRQKTVLRHGGVYLYTRAFLFQFCSWKPSRLETIERLEQLRALEHGVKIGVTRVSDWGRSVDTPEDLQAVEQHMANKEKNR